MAAPSKPVFTAQPPRIVATDQAVQLAVFSSGATSLLVRVNTVSDLPEVVWTGTFAPISTAGLFSASVPIPSMSLESGSNYEFAVFGNSSGGTSDGTFASFVAVDRAVVTLTPADGATITALPLVISWGVTDESGVSFQGLYVRDASTDAVLYYGTPSVFQRSVSLGMADLVGIEDGKSYEIDLRVGNGYGVITRVVHTITTNWAAPVTPTATVSTDPDTLAASVTVTAGVNPNLLPTYTSRTLNGVTFTVNSDGSVTLTGTATSTANGAWASTYTPPSTGTYTLSGCPSGGGASSVQLWIYDNTTGATTGIEDRGSGSTGTLNSTHQYSIRIRVQGGYVCSGETFYPQLQHGSTATDYVPYATPATDTLMVVRVNPDGTRHVLADDLESGDTVTDPLPPLGVEYTYEVTGIAATGVPSTPATVTHTNVTTCWAMNFGVGAAEVVLARFNPKASYSVEQGGEAYHFADGGEGDGLPVWYGTTEREIGGSVSWDTLTQATADRLNALMLRHPVGWLRDPFGHRWRAHMKPKFSHGIGKLWQVAIDWDAVRWVEA